MALKLITRPSHQPPESQKPPSPYCSVYLPRKQAAEIWRLLHQQPQKKWAPHRKALLKALRSNSGNRTYVEES